MANTIKLKTGSGSDPSASDLIVGEIAIRTDSGKLFTKKDNGTVAEISGSGGGIDDGDKGDITVSNGGDTFTIDNGVVTSAKIADGAIVNADINASAAIAGTKISPDFGSQNIDTGGILTVTADHPRIRLVDNNADDDFQISNFSGNFRIADSTNNADRLGIDSGGTVDVYGNLDVGAGLDVTGNITGTGDLTLTSTDTGSSASPIIELYRNSASPADADYLGQIKFTGESDDGSKEVYAKITGKIGDASSGTEDGIIEIAHTKAGSNNISARFTSTDLKLINGTGLEVAGDIEASSDINIDNINKSLKVGDISNDNYADLRQISASSYKGFTFQHSNASVLANLQGNTNQYLVLGDNNNDNSGTLFGISIDASGTVSTRLTLSGSGNLAVHNNITLGGTVDGVDIATRDTLFGGLTSSSGVLTNGVTATTQSAGDNSTKVATTAYTDTAISNLINGAPSALDTLNELAAAMNDDAAFSTTVTNSIATKMPLAGGQFTGNITFSGSQTVDGRDLSVDGSKLDGIESGATADQTKSDIDALGIAASTATTLATARTIAGVSFDGSANISLNNNAITNGAGYITATLTNEQVQDIVGGMVSGNTETGITVTYQDGDGTLDFVVGTLNQDTTGSAATLTTARTIAGTSFDGSANIDISYTNLTNKLSVGDGGLTQNNFTNTLKSKLDGIASGATNVTNTNQLTNGAGFITATLTNEQVQDIVGGMVTGNTESGITVTYQDGDGTLDFAVGTLNQDTTGNAATATALETARTIGGVSFDGTANINLAGVNTSGNQDTSGNAATATTSTRVTVTDNSSDTSCFVLFTQGATGNQLPHSGSNLTFNASSGVLTATGFAGALTGNVTGNASGSSGSCTGNAATATKLATARNIAGVSFDGSANISLNNNAITNGAGYVTSSVINSLNASNLTSGTIPDARFPSTLPAVDGSNLTGISAGATGGGSDEVFYENDQTVTTNYTITNGKNAMAAGPITINSGVTVTVGSGETLTIV